MHIQVLVTDGVFDIGLTSLLDTFAMANELMPLLPSSIEPFHVTLVGTRRRVHTAHGLSVPVVSRLPSHAPEAVVVPALGAKQPPAIHDALRSKDVRAAGAMLREWSQDGVWIGAACTATFVLAETGLLDGHSATTSWWLAPFFRQRYRQVSLEESRMLVASPPFVTAGAALAHIDLALGLVRRKSPSLAAMTARYLLVEQRVSQAAFVIPDHLAHADPIVERFEHWARANLSQGFSMAEAAQSAHVSERTLSRKVKAVTGKSPLSFFQGLRVQQAVHLLQTTTAGIESIASAVGYSDGVTLRTLLRSRLGYGIKEIRGRA